MKSILMVLVLCLSVFSYERQEWLPHWKTSSVCKDVRNQFITSHDSLRGSCDTLKGVWYDSYNDTTITTRSKIDLDHIVSLKDADASGGASWTTFQKFRFANDTTNFQITSGSTNRSKGSKTPLNWSPKSNRCEFVSRYIRTKQKYNLSIQDSVLLLKNKWCNSIK
jgi:hypothetical protein